MKLKAISLTLLWALLLAACGGQADEPPTPTATLTPDAAAFTQSAETIIAQLTQESQTTATGMALNAGNAAHTAASPAPQTESPSPTGPTPFPSTTPIPTRTFTPVPSLTPSLTTSPTWIPDDPRGQLGTPDWRANFTDPADWYTFDGDSASILMKSGELHLTAKNSEAMEIWSLSWPYLENFYLEYTFIVDETRCAGEDRYGLLFRAPTPHEGYVFGVNCNGEFSLRFWDGATFTEIEAWEASQYINVGGGATNRLGVRAEGAQLTLYLNGYRVSQIENTLSSEGKFGAFIKAALIDDFSARISEVVYWELPPSGE